jgi:uncharacterized protein involved in outer membrane biogenesis
LSKTKEALQALPGKVRPLIRPVASAGAVLIFIALTAIVALHLPSIQKEIILTGIERLEAATNLEVQIRSYRWLPFSGIRLTDVRIRSGGRQFLDCDKVRLDYRLSIKWPYLIVERVYLEKPFLQLERSADGKWLFPSPGGSGIENEPQIDSANAEKPGEPLWTRIHLPSIQIVSGTIEATQQGNTIISIKDITVAVQLKAVSGAKGSRMQMRFENLNVGQT